MIRSPVIAALACLSFAAALGYGAFALRSTAPTASGALRNTALGDRLPAPSIRQPRAAPAPLSYLAVGGGSWPESTEVSLEQDLILFKEVFGDVGTTLFAGGGSALSVRVLAPSGPLLPFEQTLRRDLGALFAPRAGRNSHYRASRLQAGPASRAAVVERLELELSAADAHALTFYVATHGEQQDAPRNNLVHLWGGGSLSVAEVASIHGGSTRPLHLLVTSCFSGGFGELAFANADSATGQAPQGERCGLFAGTWDRETSGCDPNPERRAQESYAIHMLNALRGRDRAGKPLPLASLDLDGDREVNGLEAHARARMASDSIDVPTSTAEYFLRTVQVEPAAQALTTWPEERAVRDGLLERLKVRGPREAASRLEQVGLSLVAATARLQSQEQRVEDAYLQLAQVLLTRYPVLDDPYHPDFEGMVRDHGAAIRGLLDDHPAAVAYRAEEQDLNALDGEFADLQRREAMLLRLVRADQNLLLAAALEARGGHLQDRFLHLLSCERSIRPGS